MKFSLDNEVVAEMVEWVHSKGRGFTPTSSNNGNKVTCQICKKPNHFAINCWYRFDYSYQPNDFPQALPTFAMNNSKNKSSIVDSSATSHMINDVGNFFILNYMMRMMLFMLELEIVHQFLIMNMLVFLKMKENWI